MKKKTIVVAVLLATAVFVCGNVLTNLQNRVDFPAELQTWYTENADTVHDTEWLTEHGFEYSGVLEGYHRQFSTTGGYTSVTVFDVDGSAATRFEADHDYYDTVEQFTYQFTIGTKSKDYVWINIYADNKANANTAVKEITAHLIGMV